MVLRGKNKSTTHTSIFFHPVILLLVVCLTGFICISLIKRIFSLRDKQKILQEKHDQIEALQSENERTTQEIEERQSDFYTEKVIRDELNMQKEGETVIQLPGDKK